MIMKTAAWMNRKLARPGGMHPGRHPNSWLLLATGLMIALTAPGRTEPVSGAADSGTSVDSVDTKQELPLPKDGGGIPIIKEWIKKVGVADRNSMALMKTQGRLMFVDKWGEDGLPVLTEVDMKKFNSLSMFKTLSRDELEFSLSVNQFPAKKDGKAVKPTKREFVDIIAKVMNVVAVVERDEKKPNVVRVLDTRKKKIFFKGSGPGSFADPKALHAWTTGILGYHGVVIDTNGDQVLVSASSGLFKGGDINSLVLRDSAGKTVIRPEDRKGLGLMKLERWLGKYGIFTAILNDGEIPIGSKVVIEVKASAGGHPEGAAEESASPAEAAEADEKDDDEPAGKSSPDP